LLLHTIKFTTELVNIHRNIRDKMVHVSKFEL